MKRKFSKAYKQMMKKHKKIISADAKEAAVYPFDWGFGLQVFIDHLYFMRDYYRLGENVWGEDEKGQPTREQYLNMIIAAYEDWVNCEDKYIKVIEKGEGSDEIIKSLISQGYHLQENRDKDGKLFDKVCFLYLYEDAHENNEKMFAEYKYNRKRFFDLLGEYIECLWD